MIKLTNEITDEINSLDENITKYSYELIFIGQELVINETKVDIQVKHILSRWKPPSLGKPLFVDIAALRPQLNIDITDYKGM